MSVSPASLPDGALELASPVEALRRRLQMAFSRPIETEGGETVVEALRHAMAAQGATDLPEVDDLLARFGTAPPFESLARWASEHGLILEAPSSATPSFPHVALLKDGGALAILGRDRHGRIMVGSADGIQALSERQLRAIASGRRIQVRKASDKVNAEGARHPAMPNIFRVARLVSEAPKTRLAQLLVAALLSNLLLVVLPLFTTTVYDRVVPYGAFETLTALCVGVIIVFAIDIGLRMARVNLQEAIGVAISLDLQAAFYRKLVRAPLSLSGSGTSGVTTMLYDIDGAALTAPSLIIGLLADLPFVVVMLLLVGYLGGAVVLAPLLGVIIVGIITATGSARARKATAASHRLRVKVQDQAIETAAMLPMVKALHAEDQLIDRWAGATDASAFAAHTARQTSAWSSQISLVSTQIVIAFTVVLGAIAINAGAMTLGNLAACVMLVGRIIAPANLVVYGIGHLANMRQSIGGFFAVIDRNEETGGDEQAPVARLRGRIDLHAVTFSDPGAAARSVDNVTLSIREGERVGIIGRNGCGKSTLLRLIPRLYDPDAGTILLDGADTRQFGPRQLRHAVGFMAQDTVLINDTLRANICLGFDAVDPAAFDRAVQLSGVAEFARLNPLGYNIPVGPRGEALSGGERQAVGLARAILGNPRILLLDEPTAAMDNSAEGRLIRDLPGFFAGRTVILATHRLQLLNLVDRIIWMDRGRIVADGPKAEVMATLQKAA
jgi:ATP-binding cassette subfamily C protein LapB